MLGPAPRNHPAAAWQATGRQRPGQLSARAIFTVLVALFAAALIGAPAAVASADCATAAVPTTLSTYGYDGVPQLSPRMQASSTKTRPAHAVSSRSTGVRVGPAPRLATGFAAEGGLPELSASPAALEAKFKHAADFGVTEGRGAAGFDAYGKAIDSFVQDPSTTRILGTYRGGPAILNYNASTAQVVVQATDGTFISGWQMNPAQLQNVIERGSLGGG